MLFSVVYIESHPRVHFRFATLPSISLFRRSCVSAPKRRSRPSRERSAKSNEIISFADPHLLNSVISNRYKNTGGRVEISTCFELSPYLSYSCALFCAFLHHRRTQPLSFQTVPHSLPKTTRGGGTPTFHVQTLKHSNVPPVPLQRKVFGATICKGTGFLHHPGKQLRSPRCLR